jgi:hypothetical protein
MKRVIALCLAVVMLLCAGCAQSKPKPMAPQTAQMKSICELAVMECYYHNVAKFMEENAEGWWLWEKDKKFWIEYSGVVEVGVDVSLMAIELDGTNVIITLPEAEVLDCRIDKASLTADSFIVAKDSAKITADDEVEAIAAAQKALEENAADDPVLLAEARHRVQTLLEDYVTNIGEMTGQEYTIQWVYLDEDEAAERESALESASE